ncbi:MAG: peptidylprolyl isomerase [Prevotella sp.]|jgi:peptidyl-prolyl cis-trans isomerase SurA|nr:peptidylprolyl isomerase [Prevotella sp.]
MKKPKLIALGMFALLPFAALTAHVDGVDDDDPTGNNIIDEVIWVVGDEPILKSEVEGMRLQAEMEGLRWNGDPDCAIPERIAIEKLFLHQAAIDSIEVTESEVSTNVEQRLEYFITQAGSREKLEEYRGQSISQIRNQMREELRKQMMIQRMREKLVEDITVSPAEVRRYFSNLPADSVPYVPTAVEVQIITKAPRVEQEEIDRIKDELREYTDRVNKGETTFQTLARMYSEDPGSARYGGELGFVGRGTLDPAFAAVAFNLTDPSKISKIVESEYGFHIIQLIEKRGDKVNIRHILRKPVVSQESIDRALERLDSISDDLRAEKFSFDEAASFLSDDKDTRNNHGLMANTTEDMRRTSKFRMQDLPPEVARMVDTMQVGGISRPFQMINDQGKTVCAIVKLKSRIDGHKATITEDFQVMKDVVLNKRKDECLSQWIDKKIKTIYVRVNDRYRSCKFEHQGWIK